MTLIAQKTRCPHCGSEPDDGTLLAVASTPPAPAEFCWLVELFLGDGTGNSLGWYHTGFTDIGGNSRSTQDPNKAKRYDTWKAANAASVSLGHTLQGTWRAVQHGFVAAERVQRQQAEPASAK